jgi:hypothetical protein
MKTDDVGMNKEMINDGTYIYESLIVLFFFVLLPQASMIHGKHLFEITTHVHGMESCKSAHAQKSHALQKSCAPHKVPLIKTNVTPPTPAHSTFWL